MNITFSQQANFGAAPAALHMNRRGAFLLTAVIWGANQIVITRKP